ncbi:serine/threonine protein kinase [Myxococcota bacterium]|nr:serine/threonine protein kinase [Myxococcota bacterium]MBU1897971.1 serine/threonine protein kinase [Myxococcota bacterium]
MLICLQCGAQHPGAEGGARCPRDQAALVEAEAHAQAPHDPFLGRVIAERYVVFDLLGEGGFSAVYRALQEPLGRQVALKTILPQGGEGAETRKRRFFQEAQILAQLTHPGIVRVFDYGEDEAGLFMALEMIHGQPLSERLRDGPLQITAALALCAQILDALIEPHDRQLVHRDLKPDNILLAQRRGGEQIKLIDFGIAKALIKDEGQPNTRTGITIGTVSYMAPEQLRAQGDVGPWSDQYAVGVILYQMLTGRLPFVGSEAEIAGGHLHAEPPPLPMWFKVPTQIEQIMRRALAKAPSARFEHVSHMLDALTDAARRLNAPLIEAPRVAPSPAPMEAPLDLGASTLIEAPSFVEAPPVEAPPTIRRARRRALSLPPGAARLAVGFLILTSLGLGVGLALRQWSGGGEASISNAPEVEGAEASIARVALGGGVERASLKPNHTTWSKRPGDAPGSAPPQPSVEPAVEALPPSAESRKAKQERAITRLLSEGQRSWGARHHAEALEAFEAARAQMSPDHPEWSALRDRITMLREEIEIEGLLVEARRRWRAHDLRGARAIFFRVQGLIPPNHPEARSIQDRLKMLDEELQRAR